MDTAIKSVVISCLLVLLSVFAFAETTGRKKDRFVAGDADAPIKIEVFSCYQCPPCRKFYLNTIGPLIRDYAANSKIGIIYYEFPLEIHDYARDAARYGEAARSLGQNKWQQVSEALYQHLIEWRDDKSKIDSTVSEVLSKDEMDKVRKLMKDPSIEQIIDKDIAEGYRRNIRGTPTTFIDGGGKNQKFTGNLSYSVLKNYIEGLLQ